MKIKDLLDALADYDPEMDVYVQIANGWDTWFVETDSTKVVDYSAKAGWFYSQAGDVEAEGFEAVCINDDCTPVLAIVPTDY
jgi:hypothetical protein